MCLSVSFDQDINCCSDVLEEKWYRGKTKVAQYGFELGLQMVNVGQVEACPSQACLVNHHQSLSLSIRGWPFEFYFSTYL